MLRRLPPRVLLIGLVAAAELAGLAMTADRWAHGWSSFAPLAVSL